MRSTSDTNALTVAGDWGGAVAIDGGSDYTRIVGSQEDYKIVKITRKDKVNDKMTGLSKDGEIELLKHENKLLVARLKEDQSIIATSLREFKGIETEILPENEVFAEWTTVKHTMDWLEEELEKLSLVIKVAEL